MNHRSTHRLMPVVMFVLFSFATSATTQGAEPVPGWKAAAGSVIITPQRPIWMAGYASRDKPSEGTVQNLYAKTLVLEDNRGSQLAIVTLDLIGVPREFREDVVAACRERLNLPAESILLNASHTHCGPELRLFKIRRSGGDATREAMAIEYTRGLVEKVVTMIGQTLDQLAPVRLEVTKGRAGFAMNRRLPTPNGVINSPYPDGPVDHEVPVLKVLGDDDSLRAVLFGYACHNTTLSFYQFCGDYAGYAQEYLEDAHPDTTCLFLTGCGGDQNPYPRRTLELAKQHGRALANAVETALEVRQPRSVEGPLRVALDEVSLEFQKPSEQELQAQANSGNKYQRQHGERMLAELKENGQIQTEYAFPVQTVQFGNDITLVALPGEAVIDYSLRLKADLKTDSEDGPKIWVAGYSNHVFGYLPSQRVLREGGYEGGGAMIYSTYPGSFADSVEDRVIQKVKELLSPAAQ